VVPAPTAPAAAPLTLDLNELEAQLRTTKAIGVFTKISLKNQVDDLMKLFREHYEGKTPRTMPDLRRSYDLLIMKVLSLLQDTDQMLASAIVSRARRFGACSRTRTNSPTFERESMNPRTAVLAPSLFVLALVAVPSFAQDEEAIKKDLTAVIALQGLPCGQVVAAAEQAETDYAVSCADGNLYRVYLNAAGRVVVETRK
jgi:hypothetical protein